MLQCVVETLGLAIDVDMTCIPPKVRELREKHINKIGKRCL